MNCRTKLQDRCAWYLGLLESGQGPQGRESEEAARQEQFAMNLLLQTGLIKGLTGVHYLSKPPPAGEQEEDNARLYRGNATGSLRHHHKI